ncbi:hypothetical protein [Maribacter sp. 2308TA10-17]|uniref:hypothetical protein n=1 Tax=Maribacter sp. 2308TA10-17 TaxID=3386276 RepID=UPI0039BD91DE
MIDKIISAYPHCKTNLCHEEFGVSFYLNDYNNAKCIATTDRINATCYIENSDLKIIDFIAIDDCLITSDNIKKCDALITKKKVVWFIELKEVTWSNNAALNRKKRNTNRKKAVEQLASTINDFKQKGIDFSDYFVAGLISFPPFAISNPVTAPTTSSQARVLEFANLCGYSELHEGNYIVM